MDITLIKNFLWRCVSLLKRFSNDSVERSSLYAAYLSTLFYLEIIYFMVIMVFALGLLPAVIIGLVLTALYTAHLIRLYFRRRLHRLLQLGIMELHCAFSIGFCYNIISQGYDNNPALLFMALLRAVLVIAEIPLIFLLTGERVIAKYD